MAGLKCFLTNSLKNSTYLLNWATCASFSTHSQPLWLRATPCLLAQPMKRKKKLDPINEKMKVDKKRRRLWRDCKKLLKMEKQLKPLDEIEIPYHLVDFRDKYIRERIVHSFDSLENRADLLREWSFYRKDMHSRDLQTVDKIEFSQHRALAQLLKISPSLYQKAIEFDHTLLPFNTRGVTTTPPIENYDSPDGEYIDVTKKWEPIVLPEDHSKGKVNSKKNKIRNDFEKEKLTGATGETE